MMDQYRNYSNVTVHNEDVVKICDFITSIGGDKVSYIEHEVITLLLKMIAELKSENHNLIEANKNLAQERNHLRDELWNLKYGMKGI